MTELEKIKKAKMCIEKLANGIDPISGTEISVDSVLNNVKLSRCFFFVSDILRQVIENGGEIKPERKSRRPKFEITFEELSRVEIHNDVIPISVLVNKINLCKNEQSSKKLNATTITNWLLKKDFLVEEIMRNGKKKRLPSELGESIGMNYENRVGQYGEYLVVLYNKKAQQFVIDNLIGILEESN